MQPERAVTQEYEPQAASVCAEARHESHKCSFDSLVDNFRRCAGEHVWLRRSDASRVHTDDNRARR